MKRILLLLVVSCLIISSYAQKPDKEKLSYRYTLLPAKPLPSDFKTYRVEAVTTDLNHRDAIVNKTSISGYKKLPAENTDAADFTIKVEVYPFEYSNPEQTSATSTTKVDGVEKKTTTYGYKGKMKYKFKVVMKGKNDSIYYNGELSDLYEISASGASNYENASATYKSNAEAAKMNSINSQFTSLSYYLDSDYGYPKGTLGLEVYSIKLSKKCKLDYSDLISAYDLLINSFAIVKANDDDTNTFLTALQPSLLKWENALKESDLENKDSRINEDITCMLYNNIGVTYFMAKDYTKAMEYFAKGIEIKKSFGDISDYNNNAVKLKKRAENYALKKSMSN